MREPTKQEIAKFRRAAKALGELCHAGLRVYLASGTLNLMAGTSHSDDGQPQPDNVRASAVIPGMDGGDW